MLREQLDEYVRNTRQIRILSSPDPALLESEDAYSDALRENFVQIGQLAQKNRAILSDVLDPLLQSKTPLPEETVDELNRFSEQLLNVSNVESLDIPLSHWVSVCLLEQAKKGNDEVRLLRQADYVVASSYSMINLTKRLSFGVEACSQYRERGFRAVEYFKRYFSREALRSLEDQSLRELVVINSRFLTCLYEGCEADEFSCQENLNALQSSADLARDPEVRALVPGYDWNYHLFRCMEYAGLMSEHNNGRGCTLEQRKKISEISDRLMELWNSDPAYYGGLSPRVSVELIQLKNAFLSGRTDRDVYLEQLVALYRDCEEERRTNTKVDEVHYIIDIPLEYIYALERPSGRVTPQTDHPTGGGPAEMLTEQQIQTLTRFYHVIEERALHTVGIGSISYLLEFLSMLLLHFIEVPEVRYEEFCLSAMGALHPPTYVHTMMVGDISRTLCRQVIRRMPERLVGLNGWEDPRQILAHEEEIVRYIGNAAFCHDFGKIPMIDIIFVYGRRLFDFEFDLIRHHPDLGMQMLRRIPTTRSYLDIARGHHKWHNDEAGYPTAFSMAASPKQALIDIVTCADCMDAATDSIGRSYNRGKTLDEYIEEVQEGSGTRYAEYLAQLLQDPEVHAQMEHLLLEHREGHYKSAYRMLMAKRG